MNGPQAKDSSTPVTPELRIVLLGKTGTGKSAAGNTILGRKAFVTDMSPTSVTQICKKESSHFDGRSVSVIDTPGIFDTSIKEKELKSEIEKCIIHSLPGPHVFLLVLSLAGRFTNEEKRAVKWIKENFGEEASKYTAVLFTRGDTLTKMSIECYINKSPELKELTRDCKVGYFVFDNTAIANRSQVNDLFEQIDKTVELNGGHYTSDIYKEAQRKLWWQKRWDNLDSVGGYMIGAATMAAVPQAGAALLAEEAVAISMTSLLTFAGGTAMKTFRRVFGPKPDNS